jgi:hypothetical protein
MIHVGAAYLQINLHIAALLAIVYQDGREVKLISCVWPMKLAATARHLLALFSCDTLYQRAQELQRQKARV